VVDQVLRAAANPLPEAPEFIRHNHDSDPRHGNDRTAHREFCVIQWVPIGTSPGYPGPVSLALQVWSGVALLSDPAKVTFSKFAITKGECI
jgi:hypothetical protein